MNGNEWEPMYRWERRQKLKAAADRRMAPIYEKRRKREKRRNDLRDALAIAVIVICLGSLAVAVISIKDRMAEGATRVTLSCVYQGHHYSGCGPDYAEQARERSHWWDQRFWGDKPEGDQSMQDGLAGEANQRVGNHWYSMRDLMGRRI